MTAYKSTRGGSAGRSFEDVLLTGLAEDGGLFVPESWPQIDPQSLIGLDYPTTTAKVIHPFAAECFSYDEILEMAQTAYGTFRHAAIAPLYQLDKDHFLLELFHGPTLAFKDFALQLLGRMFERVLSRSNRSVTIVGATSGDTGSAAIHGCAGRHSMKICILHPKGRVSEVQRRQMTTVPDENVLNLALEGSFDDCQHIVKALFNDLEFRKKHALAAVNSINWARLAAQAAYYFYAGLRLGNGTKPVSFCVPSGNFGDVYAGYIAKNMGLPVEKLIVATNKNDILARFFQTGTYSKAVVEPTITPSMDIQVASNFERLLFDIAGRDGAKVSSLIDEFGKTGSMDVASSLLDPYQDLFDAQRVSEEETTFEMKQCLERCQYLIDPHSAVGTAAAKRHLDRYKPIITLATAHPAKFPLAVKEATGEEARLPPHLRDIFERKEKYKVCGNDASSVKRKIEEWA